PPSPPPAGARRGARPRAPRSPAPPAPGRAACTSPGAAPPRRSAASRWPRTPRAPRVTPCADEAPRGSARLGGHSLRGRDSHVPGEAHPRQHADDQVAHVELPPAQAVPRRGGERVVVVVPALAEGHDPEEDVVAALVAALEGLRAPDVAHRVDAPG